jgi:hypothetical protein
MTAEPPLQVESREELVYLLGEACELEHSLMCDLTEACAPSPKSQVWPR